MVEIKFSEVIDAGLVDTQRLIMYANTMLHLYGSSDRITTEEELRKYAFQYPVWVNSDGSRSTKEEIIKEFSMKVKGEPNWWSCTQQITFNYGNGTINPIFT